MNKQKSLEDYKTKVIDLMKKTSKISKAQEKSLRENNSELWQACMEDFSPEVCAQGMLSGLL